MYSCVKVCLQLGIFLFNKYKFQHIEKKHIPYLYTTINIGTSLLKVPTPKLKATSSEQKGVYGRGCLTVLPLYRDVMAKKMLLMLS